MKKKIDDVNLLRKLTWSFHKSTGLDWKDLFQEAALGYLRALDTYDPKRGSPSTHMWNCISSQLKNYAKKELAYREALCPIDAEVEERSATTVEALFERFSEKARPILEVILAAPEKYDVLSAREAKAQIALTLMQQTGQKFFSPALQAGMQEIARAF